MSQFNSLSEVSWLQNGFFVTLCGFSLAYGQYLLIFPTKWVFLFAIFVFELGESFDPSVFAPRHPAHSSPLFIFCAATGSLLCGVAPSMKVLILGRAIAGLGAAGIFSSSMQTLVETTTLKERSSYMGYFGGTSATSLPIQPAEH